MCTRLHEIDKKLHLFTITLQKVFNTALRKKMLMMIKEIRTEYNEKIGIVFDRAEEKILKKRKGYLSELTTILKD